MAEHINAPQSVADYAEHYRNLGIGLVRVAPGAKAPVGNGWPDLNPEPSAFRGKDNIGVKVGAASGRLVDIDNDSREARRFSGNECFFAHAPAYSRASLPRGEAGHRWLRCKDGPDEKVVLTLPPVETKQGKRVDFGKPILELRVGRHQTVAPPSVLDGDPLAWTAGPPTALPTMAWDEVRRRAGLLAFTAILCRAYPDEGHRHDYTLWCAGALADLGVSREDAEEIMAAIVDENGDNLRSRLQNVTDTYDKKERGEKITIWRTFLESTGLSAVERELSAILGLQPGARVGGNANAIALDSPRPHIQFQRLADRLVAAGANIYRYGRTIGIVIEEPMHFGSGYPPAIVAQLVPLNPSALIGLASEHDIVFQSARGVTSGHETFMRRFLDYGHRLGLPLIHGIAHIPLIGRDEPGFDPASGLYLAYPPGLFPPAVPSPSIDDARVAMTRLLHPLRELHFATDADKAAALAAMLTAGYRPNIGLALIIFVDAPMPASGKTLFSSCLAIIATGYVPSPLALSSRADENEKRLIAAARDAESVLFIDNLSAELSGEFLASITTSEIAKIRPLGVSTTEQIRSRALVIVNGNNVRASLELERRVLRVRLDPKVPNPDERSHTFDMLDEVRRNRPQLVRDILTIVQAYERVGRPGLPVPFGNFTEWNVLRGAVMWLGFPDPVQDRQSHFAASPEVVERVALFSLIYQVFGLEPFLTRDIENRDEVRRALQLMLERNEWSSRSAGRLLKRHVDNLTHGLTLRSRMLPQGIQQWRLEGKPTSDLIAYSEGLPVERM